MPTTEDNKEYFSDVCLENTPYPGTDEVVILHTSSKKYLLGLLGMVSTKMQYYNQLVEIQRADFSSDDEYKQRVLEEFEDTVIALEDMGVGTDFGAEVF